jgi:hypothetical protein
MRGIASTGEQGQLDLGFAPDAFKTRSVTQAGAAEVELRRAAPS